jgi:hypothetical protein
MGVANGASMFAGNSYLTVSAGALDLPFGNAPVTLASFLGPSVLLQHQN